MPREAWLDKLKAKGVLYNCKQQGTWLYFIHKNKKEKKVMIQKEVRPSASFFELIE